MEVKAKFRCTTVTQFEGGKNLDGTKIAGPKQFEMKAVMGDTPENKGFNDYTPSGDMKFMVYGDKPAATFFEPGEEYIVTFTKANNNG